MKLKICFIDGSNLSYQVLEAVENLNREFGEKWDLEIVNLSKLGFGKPSNELIQSITDCDLLLMDIRGENPLIDLIKNITANLNITVIPLLGGGEKLCSTAKMKNYNASKVFEKEILKNSISNFRGGPESLVINNIKEFVEESILEDIKNYLKVINYWGINGKANIKNMILMLSRIYGGIDNLQEEEVKFVPINGIYNPLKDKSYYSAKEYAIDNNFDLSKPTIAIVYYSGMHFENCLVPTKMMIEKFEKKANILPIISDGIRNLDTIEKYCLENNECHIDLLINMTWFRLNGGPLGGNGIDTINLLNKLNVPMYHPVTMYSRQVKDWESDITGISQIDYLANVILPEIDGAIESIPVCGSVDLSNVSKGLEKIVPIEDRIEKVVNRGLKLSKLSKMNNKDKKISILLYNYPPGEGNLGNASYLDTFESINNILERLKQEGYDVKDLDDDLLNKFENYGVVNSGSYHGLSDNFIKVDVNNYKKWLDKMPKIKADIERVWQEAPGDIMCNEKYIYLPVIKCKNILIGLQPSKGIHEDSDKLYHDKNIPPHHQYMAFYYYLQNEFKTDSIIHVGTHGTLEFLPGKEMGMSKECYSDLLIGDIPHFYIYQVSNPSEATIAKRRSHATLVSYKTPSITSSGLYGDLLLIEDLMYQLEEAKLFSPQRVSLIENNILDILNKGNWGVSTIDEIDNLLNSYKRQVIPKGLHTFGKYTNKEELISFIQNILKYDRGTLKSLNRVIYEKLYSQNNITYDEIIEKKNSILNEIDIKSYEIIKDLVDESIDFKNKYREYLLDENIKEIYDFALVNIKNITTNKELDALINGLSGKFVEPGLAGDILRTPEVMPSGRNLYQFDPMKIPTNTACERGSKIALNTLNKYYDKYNEYPKKTGLILWGFETAKTYGETIGQILEYIGVKVVSKPGDWFPKLEVVPLEKLNHPRIDVVVNICGFFRDMFPNVVDLLDRAFRMIADLDESEESNYVKLNSNIEKKSLSRFIPDENYVDIMSKSRIFGPKNGEYGTRLTSIIETTNWEEENQLSTTYNEDMCYIYSMMFKGNEAKELFKSQSSKIELVSQVQDTFEYEVTDLDHYYEFLGGLSSVVRENSGKNPEIVVTNTSSEEIITEDLKDAIRRGVKSRNFNPKWIDELLKHKYHGAQKISDRVQYQIGLAATTNKVDNWVFEESFNTYLNDEEMLKKLKENNLHATLDITKRIYESYQRNYWDASEEQIQKLKDIYLELEKDIELGGVLV